MSDTEKLFPQVPESRTVPKKGITIARSVAEAGTISEKRIAVRCVVKTRVFAEKSVVTASDIKPSRIESEKRIVQA